MDDSLLNVADVHSLAGDGESLVDKASDFVTKGIPLALASGFTSIANTGISLGNMFGDFEKIDFAQKVREYDDDLGKYYDEHQVGIDIGGFVATSLIPGTLGLKGLKALQTVGNGEGIGKTTYQLAGYFANKQEKYLKLAAETISDPTHSLFGIINANKLKAIAAGFGEQALQGAVFETSVLLTMNQNPVMEPRDRNYLQNIIYHLPQLVENAAIYGGVGGLIGAAVTGGKIKSLILEQDKLDFPHITASQLGLNNLNPGAQAAHAYAVLDDLKSSLKQMQAIAQDVPREGQIAITSRSLNLQEKTIQAYEEEFQKFVTKKLVGEKDIDIAQLLLKNIDDVKIIKENGFDIPQTELVARILGAAKKVGRVTEEITEESGSKLPFRIVKLAGEGKGSILDSVYPVAGDLGKVTIDGEKAYLGSKILEVPKKFNPASNSPTESSNQFLVAHLKSNPENKAISSTNLPAIESAVLRGENPEITGYSGFQSQASDILSELKKDAIQELRLLGKGDDYISRALNVSRAFIEDSTKGAAILGSFSERALEDLTKPMHVKIGYTGVREDAKFYAEGMRHLQERVSLSQAQRENAAVNIFGENYQNFVPPKGILSFTPTISSAAGFVTSADGARNSTMLIAMQSGKMIDKLAKEQASRWGEKLAPFVAEISSDSEKLYTRNLVATTLRASAENMWRVPAELHPGGIETNLILVPKSVLTESVPKGSDPIQFIQDSIAGLDRQTIVKLPLDSTEAKFLISRQELTAEQAKKWNVAFAARGKTTHFDEHAFYESPIDTERQPFFALVRHNNPLEDIRPLSVVVAQSAESLKQKIAEIETKLGDLVEVFKKEDIKTNKELQGVYESGLLFGKTAVDSSLQKLGKLSDYIPRKDDYIFKEQEAWIWKQSQAIHRQGVELLYGGELAELRFLENNWNKNYSKFGQKALETADNPYTQVVNTFMNVSNKSVYQNFWGKFNEATQSAYTGMTDAYNTAFKDAQDGKLSYEAANKVAKEHGYSNAAEKVSQEVFRETFKDNNSLSKLVSQVNLATGTLMIRMDPLNSLINIMSLPVLFAAESSAARREITKQLGLEVGIPGSQHSIPTAMPLLMDGIKSYWNKEVMNIGGTGVNLKQFFKDIGAIRTNPQQVQDSIAIPLDSLRSEGGALNWVKNLSKQVGDFGARYSGNDFAEEFVRYQAAYAGMKFAQVQGITSRGELAAYINMFVNRVHGNYLASQRPTIFSGPVGQAISLFQTYQFNMIQQMTRYLQEGNVKASTIALGMQNTIFGLQGNPLFWQLNQYIGNSNSKHNDLVTGLGNTVGTGGGITDPARWMLYGLGANALQVNLYNRGDLTPRYTTIVPTAPQDIPAISIGTKAISSFIDSIQAAGNGTPVSQAILQGISHAGFNRPLAGLASLVAGGKVSNQGTLMAAYNDFDSFTVGAKLAGGEPLNNAVAFDAFYRLQGYRSNQAKQMGELAEAVKLTVAGKQGEIDPEQVQGFMQKYAEKGGDMQHFNKFMINATKGANQSVVNKMKQNIANPLAQRQLGWLGADLSDYANQQ